jgi:hypothetical protein
MTFFRINISTSYRHINTTHLTHLNVSISLYSWLQKKNGNCQNKTDTFLQFFHSVKPSYERQVRINVKIQ